MRVLLRAKAGTSLPVYIKDLGSEATGTAVKNRRRVRETERKKALKREAFGL